MARDSLHAWICGDYIGHFERDFDLDPPRFVYDEGATRSLSLSLPRDSTAEAGAPLHYLNGLLPDQPRARLLIQQATGAQTDQPWDLLSTIGGDLAGGLVLHQDLNGIDLETEYTSLALEDQIAARIADIKQTGDDFILAAGSSSPRFSLAGAQTKFALSITSRGELFWSDSATPSTHIVKPESKVHAGLELIESAALALARRVGVFSPPATQMTFAGQTAFVIQRFDRTRDLGSDRVSRLHVEDMAQALGPNASDKYQVDASEIVCLLNRHSSGVEQAYVFFRQYIFNTIIGNSDAHAKNYSVIHTQEGEVRVSPLYDAIPIGLFPGYSPDLAMPVGHENRPGFVSRSDWVLAAQTSGLEVDRTLDIVSDVATGVLEHLGETIGAVPHVRINAERMNSIRRNAERQLEK